MSDMQYSVNRSKAPQYSLVFGIISLLGGPLIGFLGLIIRILKRLRIIYFEGRVGFGGIAGGLGLILGLLFGGIGLIIGFIALRKIKAGASPMSSKNRAMLGLTLSGISVVLSILIFFFILLTLEIYS